MFTSNCGSVLHHFDISDFEECCDLEIWSGSLKVIETSTFDSLHMVSYLCRMVIVTLSPKVTIFEIFTFETLRDLGNPG